MQKKSGAVTVHVRRSAAVIAAMTFVVFLFVYQLIDISGLINGSNPEADRRTEQLQASEIKKITTEGRFLDSKGEPITEPGEAGKGAVILFDECYSYLIGYNSPVYGTSGLRKTFYDDLFYGGEDNVGAEITLTTDNGLQQFCYDLLEGTTGSIIVMDRETGAILCCASRGSDEVGYNANLIDENFECYSQISEFFLNPATKASDPPGSTFKILTSCAMVENGMADYTYDDTGVIKAGAGEIHNYGGAVYGSGIGLERALNKSINTYFCSAGMTLGAGKLQAAAQGFLFGEDIPLDFVTLHSNFDLGNLNDDMLTASAAFGQGRTVVSPLQLVMMMDAVMNGGEMMKPYLIAQKTDDGRTTYEAQSEALAQAVGKETADTVKTLLHSNALYYGLSEQDFGMVYAKTGTADQSGGGNHAYYLMGVEGMPSGDYIVLVDQRNTGSLSNSLKSRAVSVLNYLQTME